MKLSVAVPFICLALSVAAFGDELVKSAQSELKSLGFYYGEITGVNSPETVAAIKRYQIRNGLEVSGTLSKETLEAMGIGSNAPAAAEPPPTLKTPERKAVPVERGSTSSNSKSPRAASTAPSSTSSSRPPPS